MTFASSSLPSAFADDVAGALKRETSAARKLTTDAANNTSAITMYDWFNIVTREVKKLNGVTASTTEINKVDGLTTYALGATPLGTGTAGCAFGTKRVGVTGSYVMPAASLGLTSVLAGGAGYSAATTLSAGTLVATLNSYISTGASSIVARVYTPTGAGNALKLSGVKQSVTVWAIGAKS